MPRPTNQTGLVIPRAASWNDLCKEYNNSRDRREVGNLGDDKIYHAVGWINARNMTGQQLGDCNIVGIGPPTILPGDNLPSFKRILSHDVVAPTDCRKIGLSFKPAPPTRFTCVTLSGVGVIQVDVLAAHVGPDPDTGEERWACRANIIPGDIDCVVSDPAGGITVLWVEGQDANGVPPVGKNFARVVVGNPTHCDVTDDDAPTQEEFDQKCEELDTLRDCVCELLDQMDAANVLPTVTIDAIKTQCGCDPGNPINTNCPDCDVPQMATVDITGSFPYQIPGPGFPATISLFLTSAQPGAGLNNFVPDSIANFESEYANCLTGISFDSGGGCTYPIVKVTCPVNIPGVWSSNFPDDNDVITAICFDAQLVNLLPGQWDVSFQNFEFVGMNRTYTPGVGNGGPAGAMGFTAETGCAGGTATTSAASSGQANLPWADPTVVLTF